MSKTSESTVEPDSLPLIRDVKWDPVPDAVCRYKVSCRADVGTPIFAAIFGGKVVGNDCDSPPGPVMFRAIQGNPGYYEADVCLCGIGRSETVVIIISEPFTRYPNRPSDAVTFTVVTPDENCPDCPRLGDTKPAAHGEGRVPSSPSDIKRIDNIKWSIEDNTKCKYKIEVDADAGPPHMAVMYNNKQVGGECDHPSNPVTFTLKSGTTKTYEATVCLCGVVQDDSVHVVVYEKPPGDPNAPGDGAAFKYKSTIAPCVCVEHGAHMTGANRKATKPKVKKQVKSKPAKPAKKAIAKKKPAPKKPAKPVKKKPGRRK